MDQLRVALMGAGRRAQEYVQVLKVMADRFRLIAVCDTDQGAATILAEANDASAYTNGDRLFANEQVDFGLSLIHI